MPQYTFHIEQHGRWFIGSCEEVPGANGQGRTRELCEENLRNAIDLILEDNAAVDEVDGVPKEKGRAPKEFSQLAELQVAGLLAEAGWRVYFPHRDDGFDFIAAKSVDQGMIIRPVQVKGKYPEEEKLDKAAYGFIGKLTQVHPEMVLAIPYFETGAIPRIQCVAFMPYRMLRQHSKGWKCQPAKFVRGVTRIRGDHARFFDEAGLNRMSESTWSQDRLLTSTAQ